MSIEPGTVAIEEAGGITVAGGRVLVLLSPPNKWSFPKGHIDARESFVRAAEREVLEETGITARAEAFISRFAYVLRGSIYDLRLYRMAYVAGNPINKEHVNTEALWLTFEDAIGASPYDPHYLEALQKTIQALSRRTELAVPSETEIQAVTRILGHPVELEPLSFQWASRPLFRLRGQNLVVRIYKNDAEAQRSARVLELAQDLPVPEIVTREGALLVTTWIEGEPLPAGQPLTPGYLKKAGSLLAQLHATPVPGSNRVAATLQAEKYFDYRFHKSLRAILDAGLITHEKKTGLEQQYAAGKPEHFNIAPVHWDFVTNNLLRVGERLALIDFESSRLFADGYDLSKACFNMARQPQKLNNFLNGYAAFRSPDDWLKHRQFYDIFFLVRNLANRLQRPQFSFADPLSALNNYQSPFAGAL